MTATTRNAGHLDAQPDAALPGEQEVLDRAAGENFSVASLVLGRRARDHLLAIYGFARLVDQLGDEVAGDRLAPLDALEADLDRVFDGGAGAPAAARGSRPRCASSTCRASRSCG